MKNKVALIFAFMAVGFSFPALSSTFNLYEQSWFSRKKKKEVPPPSAYQQLTQRDTLALCGVMNVLKKDKDYYLEIPKQLLGRQVLVSNKLLQVPAELNEAGVNKGINYENKTIVFEWERQLGRILIREQRATPEVLAGHAMALSVQENYINPLIASLKVEAVSKDSASVVVKVTDLFNGRDNSLNDVFNLINLGTSANSELSRILEMRSYDGNVLSNHRGARGKKQNQHHRCGEFFAYFATRNGHAW